MLTNNTIARLTTPTEEAITRAKCSFALRLEHVDFITDLDWELLATLREYDHGTVDHNIQTLFFARDQITREHKLPLPNGTIRLRDLMKDVPAFEQGCLHHDIGKITVDPNIMFKKGPFEPHEREIVETHEDASRQILEFYGLKKAAKVASQHHNYRKAAPESVFRIPQLGIDVSEADILHLADVQHALLQSRSYRKGLTSLKALRIMAEQAMDGKVGKEISCLWIKSEMDKLRRSYLLRPESASWSETENYTIINSFIKEEWANLALLCEKANP
ncbi:HD domain-containing protein, partial [Candidatus Falkowbacteria bacterium]|nr:HD domain-containing protein [Candidatus Falkowbacteria bacterium]